MLFLGMTVISKCGLVLFSLGIGGLVFLLYKDTRYLNRKLENILHTMKGLENK